MLLCENKEKFSAENFVQRLLKEGTKTPCDDSVPSFNQNEIPQFYDEEKFKRGQQFFSDNIFALYFSKFLGLILTLAVPSVLDILIMTKNSGCVFSSYKRYIATLFHMNVWYESDLKENSSLWMSIKKVKSMHNKASKMAVNRKLKVITQKDMAVTQFGFMGLAVCRSELVGLHNISEEDWSGLIHFWKVIGHIMGIEERFNICRNSVEETKQICDVLIKEVLLPEIKEKRTSYIEMTQYVVNGMWNMIPILNYNVVMSYLWNTIHNKHYYGETNTQKDLEKNTFFELKMFEIWMLRFYYWCLDSLQYNFVRIYLNSQHKFSLFLMKYFPFLTIFTFGKNTLVKI